MQGQDGMHDMGAEAVFPPPSVRFKLTAEFVAQASGAAAYLKQAILSPEERSLLRTVLATPEALNRMCRLEILAELNSKPGPFENQFAGFDGKDILVSVLPYLPEDEQAFWRRAMSASPEVTGDRLVMLFESFQTVLKGVAIEDMTTGEAIPLQARPGREL